MVEDDPEFSCSLRELLENANYAVENVEDGHQALLRLGQGLPQAIILAWNLPRLGGTAVLEWTRRRSSIPVLVISGSPLESVFTNAFALGADDFLSKPFSGQELLVRLSVRLGQAQQRIPPRTQLGNLLVDWARAEVYRGSQPVLLTPLEFQLLQALYRHRDRVLTRPWLLENVWGHGEVGGDRLIDASVKRLRRKVGAHMIQTVRGLGFRLAFP
ncbi:hypothetical protein ABS71_07360 [bacterium SCN 62-11]|nr:MAG: hypothetical protein ABS71_07360 [bacterium SCN 62-11]